MPFQHMPEPLALWSPPAAAPAFHVIFPALAVGLVSYLAVLQCLWLGTRNPAFRNLCRAWTPIFVVVLAMALVSSLVLAGRDKATRGAETLPGVGLVLGAFVWTALLVAAASAWRLLKEPEDVESCLALKMSIGMFVITGPLQLVGGELSGEGLLSLQPTALAVLGTVPPTVAFDLVMTILGVWGGLLAWRGGLERARIFLRVCVLFGSAGLAATFAGWALAAAFVRSFGLLALQGFVIALGAALIVRLIARGTAGAVEAAS